METAFSTHHSEGSRAVLSLLQVIPVFPFSLRERSGVPDDEGTTPFAIEKQY